MSAMDLSTYILASFATVEDARQALNPAHFTVVNFHLSESATTILKKEGLLAPEGHPFIHLGIHDAKHDSLVIEFVDGMSTPAQTFYQSVTHTCAQAHEKHVLTSAT